MAEGYQYSSLGGRLCLDFCNTVGGHHTDPNTGALVIAADHLRGYEDLLEWARQLGVVAEDVVARLRGVAERRPDEADAVWRRALDLRETLYRIFVAVDREQAADARDLAAFNAVLAETMPHARLVSEDGGFRWDWEEAGDALDQVLWPVARSAADVLTAGDLRRVRACEGETCGWLFLDLSKNHSRRWCSMEDCGNRAKAKRHYRRVKTVG